MWMFTLSRCSDGTCGEVFCIPIVLQGEGKWNWGPRRSRSVSLPLPHPDESGSPHLSLCPVLLETLRGISWEFGHAEPCRCVTPSSSGTMPNICLVQPEKCPEHMSSCGIFRALFRGSEVIVYLLKPPEERILSPSSSNHRFVGGLTTLRLSDKTVTSCTAGRCRPDL